jgi:two-component system sensor histidine kinase TctE
MPQAIAKDIDLGLEIEPAVLHGNAFLLRELVSNLLDNAIRYSPRGGAVTMRVFSRDETVFVEVEDEGPGIPPAERANVFRRFYRIDGTQGDGCGLGLAIVAEIAGLHGARVEIHEPRGGGAGTLAVVSFHDDKLLPRSSTGLAADSAAAPRRLADIPDAKKR